MSARRAVCHVIRHSSFCLLFLCAAAPAWAREWVDASGKFRIEAELIAVRNGKAILEKPDGSVISIPVDKLSVADQAFLKNQSAPATPPTVLPATPAPTTTPAAAAPVTAEGAALALKAQGVLKTNCYRCHGEDGASEGGFNFVLNLEKLAKTVVKPRNSGGSLENF